MFLCCSNPNNEVNDITQNIQLCQIHNKPMLFVCQTTQTCINQSLFCTDCSDKHKGHQWETLKDFFTQEVKSILKNVQNTKEDKVESILQITLQNFLRFKARIQYRLIQLQDSLKQYFERLKSKYPPLEEIQLETKTIDNEQMSKIHQVLIKKQRGEWIQSLQEDINRVLQPTQKQIIQYLDDIQDIISQQQWDQQVIREQNISKYLNKHFTKGVKQPLQYFKFSKKQKSQFITVNRQECSAIYTNDQFNNIKRPAILTTKSLTNEHNQVEFHISKIPKTAFFFDSTIIGVGVCIVDKARAFNFVNLHKHSHGAYMICSNSKVYHSSMPEFNSQTSFKFSQGDTVQLNIDIKKKILHFQCKGCKKRKFQMKLGLSQRHMVKLRPFICFDGQEGASVMLSNKKPLKPFKKQVQQKNGKYKQQTQQNSTKETSSQASVL